MKNFVLVGLVAGLPLLLPALAPAAATMKPGLWEIATSMEMPGLPFQPPPQTVRHCYTAEEVSRKPLPTDDSCRITDLKTAGSKVSWKVECKGEAAGRGEGEVTYQGDSAYEGKTRMQMEGMTVTTRYKGKRLGDCR